MGLSARLSNAVCVASNVFLSSVCSEIGDEEVENRLEVVGVGGVHEEYIVTLNTVARDAFTHCNRSMRLYSAGLEEQVYAGVGCCGPSAEADAMRLTR